MKRPWFRGVAGTTAFRSALLIVGLFLAVTGLMVWVLFVATNRLLTERVLVALGAEAALLEDMAKVDGLGELARSIAARSRPEGPGLYILTHADGRKLVGNLNRIPPEIQSELQHDPTKSRTGGVFRYHPANLSRSHEDGDGRLAVALSVALDGARLVVGRDVEDQRLFAAEIRRIFLIGTAILALAGFLAAYASSRTVLARVETINAAARAIIEGNLSQRVPLQGSGDELDGLGRNLNAMLDRIEQLLAGLREVSENIAHDLKTPLTRLRNRVESALDTPHDATAHRDALAYVLLGADELITTFNALLLIARLEAGAIEENTEVFDASLLVRDVAELYEPVAETNGFEIVARAETPLLVRANRQLLGQAVANLTDNAIKYGIPPNADAAEGKPTSHARQIILAARTTETDVELSVADRGPGIKPEDRDRVLRRFVRLEESRTQPGTGLGLCLAAGVARLHGGALRLEDHAPGLRVVLVLPKRNVGMSGLPEISTSQVQTGPRPNTQ